MIPTKDVTNSTLDEQLNKDIEQAEKQSQEDIKKSKPKMAQAVATKYLKFVIIGISAIGVAYKMFFSSTNDTPKKKKKINVQQNQMKEEDKKQIEMASETLGKTGKGNINKDKSDIKKISSIEENSLSNAENLSMVSVPKLALPSVPSVPTIDKIIVKKEQIGDEVVKIETNYQSDIRKLQDEMKKLKEENKKLTESQKQLKTNIKTLTEASKNTPIQSQVITSPSNNLKGNIGRNSPIKQQGNNIDNIGNKKKNNKNRAPRSAEISPTEEALDEMFILSGNGPTERTNTGSSDSKKDFIIFDGSSISEVSEVKDTNSTGEQKLTNLENTIATGKIMEAVLETAINSESAGTIRAVISKDVLGEMGNKILIPRGSRVYGSYTTAATATQTRLLLTWNKVIRPDGVVISMNAATYDQSGKKGIEGAIDTRYGELFKNALLYSFVTLGTAIAVEKIAGIKGTSVTTNGSTSVTNISPASTAATSVVETVQDIADKMTDGLTEDLDPVISIPQGIVLKIISNTDIVINTAYRRTKQNIQL